MFFSVRANPLSFLFRKQACLSYLVVYALVFASAAHAHPALIIDALQDFESQTDQGHTINHASLISEVNRLADQQLAEVTSRDKTLEESTDQPTVTLDNVVITETREASTPGAKTLHIVGATEETTQRHVQTHSKYQPIIETVITANLWERISAGFTMATIHHPAVKKYEKQYLNNPRFLQSMTQNAQKYLYHVTQAVEQYNMPSEIALLPIVESHFKPNAVSRSRAVGLWQIMPATGKHLGLRQNWWIDDRKSVEASTQAALGYLNSLYERFGDWELALASYNAGGGTVSRAMKRNRAANLATDYLSLPLPKETKQYLPKLQAIKNIVSNASEYGVYQDIVNDTPYFTSVSTPQQIDKTLVAEFAQISLEELNALNPQFKRPVIMAQHGQQLLLPIDAAANFEYALSEYAHPLVSWQRYTMPAGQRLSKTAKRFGISTKKLGKVNQVSTHRRARRPIKLLVPDHQVLQQRKQAYRNDVMDTGQMLALQQTNNLSTSTIQSLSKNYKRYYRANKKRQKTYLVKRGDTLSGIAQRFKLSLAKLQRMNHLKNRLLKAGQRIRLY